MTKHRVDELALRVRGPADGAVAARVEAFARAVLDRAATDLETRRPGRLVFVRRLLVRWRLSAVALDDPGAVARCAADLTDALASAADLVPAPGDDFAVFDDATDWRAERVRAAAAGRSAWYLESPDAPDPLSRLLDPAARAETVAVLVRLAGAGQLVHVLARLPVEVPTQLADVLGAPRVPTVASIERWLATAQPTASGEPPSISARADALAPAAQLVLLFAEATLLGWPAVRAARAELVAALDAPALPDVPVLVPAPGSLGPEPRVVSPRPASAAVRTRYGGLFLLLARVLELDLARLLWEACLPEGPIFTRAAEGLLGALDDPAPQAFGGASSRDPFAADREQRARFAAGALASFVEAVPRRGLAELPTADLCLTHRPEGRWLIATAIDSPFVLFTHPADEPADVTAGLDTFLATWTGSVTAPRGLLSADRSGRLRATAARVAPLIPVGPPDGSAVTVAQVIGTACQLFACRIGAPTVAPAELVERYLTIPARLVWEPEALTITMSIGAIDLAVRRASLDADPGWVPWLNRSVRLVFAGDDEA